MIPDFSSDPNRLAIKSAICAFYRIGEWDEAEYDAQGNETKARTKVHDWPDDEEINGIQITSTQLIIQRRAGPNVHFTLKGRAKGYYRS